jgi:hypothetical protein
LDTVTVMIGGVAVEKEDADKICALYGETREKAVVFAKEAMEKKES